MESWNLKKLTELSKLENPVLIEGLPGIGNVGKIAVDYIIEEIKPTKLLEFTSESFPNCVFVNEENLIELPSIELYHKKVNGKDLLFLAGDIQPSEEKSCYEFTSKVLDIFQELGGKEIVTLGGIGLNALPKDPKVYCTANNKDIIKKYKNGSSISTEIYGVVGPIVGVTGLLLGLAAKRDINSIAFLAETLGHPMYLGIKGAKELLKILEKNFTFNIEFSKLDEEIEELEEEFPEENPPKPRRLRRFGGDTAYIG